MEEEAWQRQILQGPQDDGEEEEEAQDLVGEALRS